MLGSDPGDQSILRIPSVLAPYHEVIIHVEPGKNLSSHKVETFGS